MTSVPSTRRLRWALTACVLALVAIVCIVASNAFPSTEAVRLRNALLIRNQSFVDWEPPQAAAGFKLETVPMPANIVQAVERIRQQVEAASDLGELDVARALAGHINERAVHGGQISELDVGATYERIVSEGTGYCADVVDVYVALALAAGLYVRPWAFSFDGFGGSGHIVVEVYDRQRRQWVLLDVFNNVMPVERVSRQPLEVSQFLTLFRADPESVEFVPIAPGRVRIPVYEKLVDYYRRGIDQWYFWNGNNVVSRGSHLLVQATAWVAEPLGEFAAVMLGRYPEILPIRTDTNSAAVAAMVSLRTSLIAAFLAAATLTILIALQCLLLWRIAWEGRGDQAGRARLPSAGVRSR